MGFPFRLRICPDIIKTGSEEDALVPFCGKGMPTRCMYKFILSHSPKVLSRLGRNTPQIARCLSTRTLPAYSNLGKILVQLLFIQTLTDPKSEIWVLFVHVQLCIMVIELPQNLC